MTTKRGRTQSDSYLPFLSLLFFVVVEISCEKSLVCVQQVWYLNRCAASRVPRGPKRRRRASERARIVSSIQTERHTELKKERGTSVCSAGAWRCGLPIYCCNNGVPPPPHIAQSYFRFIALWRRSKAQNAIDAARKLSKLAAKLDQVEFRAVMPILSWRNETLTLRYDGMCITHEQKRRKVSHTNNPSKWGGVVSHPAPQRRLLMQCNHNAMRRW